VKSVGCGRIRHRRPAVFDQRRRVIDILLGRKMSMKHRSQGQKNPSTVNRIEVEQHAELRYLQRVDAAAQNPSERIREMFRRGYPDPSADVESGRCRRSGDHLIVYRGSEDRPEVIKRLREGERRGREKERTDLFRMVGK